MPHDAKAWDEIAARAADWLVRLDAGSADPTEFERWRGSDPRHAAAFAQVASAWRSTGDLRWAPGDDSAPGDGPSAEVEEPRRAGMGRRAAIAGMAAGVAAAIGGATLWMQTRRDGAATGVGERRIVRLPDGAFANLNTDTEITWRLAETLEIWVERGEAAIRLAPGNRSRAILHAAKLSAELVGGSYNLRLFGQGPRLAVMAGIAIVRGAGGPLAETVRANEVLIGDASGFTRTTLTDSEREQSEAWQRGEIVFDGMELAAALNEFNRYLARPIRLADPAIGTIRLGGRFRTDDPAGFLQSLSDGFGIHSRRAESAILLYRR